MKKKQWVCHQDKVPKNPITGGNAKADLVSTWSTYEEALSGLKRFNFSGIGFQFGLPLNDNDALETERVTGIDLDHVISPLLAILTGNLSLSPQEPRN